MGIESLVASEAARLLIRRPDKLKHTAGLYLMSFLDPEVGRVSRAAYFFTRYIDDLLDGERTLPKSQQILPHIAAIRSQIETGKFTREPKIMELAEYSLGIIQRKASSRDNPRQDFLDLIDVMVFDYQRHQAREEMSTEQLQDYYKRTFFTLNNIILVELGSTLRAVDIPTFSLCQGRVYSVEHLQADWRTGIINIPKDVLETAALTSKSPYEMVKSSPIINAWARKELQESKEELLSLRKMFRTSRERITPRMYDVLIGSMLHVTDKPSIF